MQTDLFREEAYNNYSSMLKTDKQIKSVGINTFVIILLIVIVFTAVMVWFVTGNITETTSISGIITTDGGNISICTDHAGRISDVFVWDGALVNVGDVIAVIPDEDTLDEIEDLIAAGADERVIEKARDEYYSSSFVRAMKSGVIRSVASDGEYVESGDVVAKMTVMEEHANASKLLAFIPSDEVQSIETGLEVQVSPDFAPREEYGYIKAYISDIGSYPCAKENIIEAYNMDELKNVLSDGVNYITVEVTFISDSKSGSNVKWSSSKGSRLSVDVGTICTGSIVVKSCKPYEWFLN